MTDPGIFSPEVRCDWYDATVDGWSHRDLVNGLCEDLGAMPRQVAPMRGYGSTIQLVDTSEGVQASRALILFDHPKNPERVYVSANGESGPVARDFLIRNGLDHSCRRYDAAVDMRITDVAFTKRWNKMVLRCEEDSKNWSQVGSPITGRTLYCNMRRKTALTSKNVKPVEAQVVFYEKGKEKGIDAMSDWKRVEMRLRPEKPEAQAAAALLEPSDVWGVFKWTAAMLEIATAGTLSASASAYPRFKMSLPEVEQEMRKIRAMKSLAHVGQQYSRTYETLREIVGEEEADRLWLDAVKYPHSDAETPAEMYAALYQDRKTSH